ncbi:PREDICTED: BSD domain-containing protein 1-like [Ipomoea nil]|uniref:BSD domain-containing protein 1-like n=1 Tax=Ipomoea nil TaxID=35883 RepID=UPI000901FB14|nr:PREDICTED: BSD domain-containing protein 1-like [Ipomoea nil]
MDFFKSVFTEEQDYSDTEDTEISSSNLDVQAQPESPPGAPDGNPNIPAIVNAWGFGSGLLKTLASKSESVIQNYRRDLEEFSSGLQKETAIIREAASRAVQDLPAHIESGATAAQESLETVGQAIDDIGSSVAEIIVQGKDSILAPEDSDNEFSENSGRNDRSDDVYKQHLNSNAKPYSRIDALIRAIQCDAKTYCEEPEDSEDYNEWKLGFVFEEKLVEIGDLVEENNVIGEIYSEIVPSKVDRETFWSRYFYKIHRVKKAEEARVRLVKRVISGEEDEELTWDVEDDNDNNNNGSCDVLRKEIAETENGVDSLHIEEDKQKNSETAKDANVSASEAKTHDEKGDSEADAESSGEKLRFKPDDKGASEAKNDNSDFSVVSSRQSSREEEDLGWDAIEDMESICESKATGQANTIRADLHKRINVGNEEEELTWDIDDDDDDVPSKP